MAKKKKAQPIKEDIYPRSIETFRRVDDFDIRNIKYNSDGPSCFNGIVSIHKYRVTVEIIEEPVSVYEERLEKLWVECDNLHHWYPLELAAKGIGYTFKGECGSQRKPRN